MPPPGQAPSQSTLALARRHQPNVKSTRGAQTSPTSTHQPGYPKTAPKTASITRSRPHHRKVHTRQRQQAVPQKARPRRAVATAEAKQVEVRNLRAGLSWVGGWANSFPVSCGILCCHFLALVTERIADLIDARRALRCFFALSLRSAWSVQPSA